VIQLKIVETFFKRPLIELVSHREEFLVANGCLDLGTAYRASLCAVDALALGTDRSRLECGMAGRSDNRRRPYEWRINKTEKTVMVNPTMEFGIAEPGAAFSRARCKARHHAKTTEFIQRQSWTVGIAACPRPESLSPSRSYQRRDRR